MQWFANTAERLEKGRIYTRKDLINMLHADYPYVSRNSYQWGVAEMLANGMIEKIGYNQYRCVEGDVKKQYVPQYSELSERIITLLREKIPETKAVLFETALLNEFLPEKLIDNVLFLEVEKAKVQGVFHMLQEYGIPNLIYSPRKKDFLFFRINNSVVVRGLTSEAPLERGRLNEIVIEKLLVDIFCDKLIRLTYPAEAFSDIAKVARERYLVQSPKLLRYARRREREQQIVSAFPELATDRQKADEFRDLYADNVTIAAQEILQTLPEQQQEFFMTISGAKVSQGEIARMYGISPQAVTNRIKKLYNTIIRRLEKEYGFDEADIKHVFKYKSPVRFLRAVR